MNDLSSAAVICARRVSDEERSRTLPRHFGANYIIVEDAIYSWMDQLSEQYSGGFWQFYELSNGGFYMAPTYEGLAVQVEGKGYQGRMSGDAAGIVACLFAFSHLSFRIRDDMFARHYQLLLPFAAEHREAGAIVAAID
jgi:hypothetical protein